MTNENQTELQEPVRLTPEELNQLARDFQAGHIYSDRHIAAKYNYRDNEAALRDISMVFLPMALGGLAGVDTSKVGLLYEHVGKAGPRSVNGMPMFMSMKVLHLEDVGPLWNKIEALEKAMSSALGEDDAGS